ncbi:HU family DNA-binding protein [Williamwhitmania taraxaci]|uniref:DNA-binding protein, histone-like, putative n=1 Tax=Williamwhitmania taraxaci TaxID=1640674 RepID=A0A1G6J1Z6_9BACT|nr:HU family DNA-binding protein [Williamwhitmania taraxaci]SDC12864.1 DNA-binding protein, histone-like, putative [Williamwhitmania taraxaci]
MSGIKYKVTEKGQPGVIGGGVKKCYAQVVFGDEVTVDDLSKEIEKFCSLSEPDVRAVILALENVIQTKLSEGRIVRLEKLGSLYPAISSQGEEKAEDVDANSIKSVSVNYRPGARILSAMNDAGFKKV